MLLHSRAVKKIAFPFARVHAALRVKWWHRLAFLLFCVTLPVTLLLTVALLGEQRDRDMMSCLAPSLDKPPATTADIERCAAGEPSNLQHWTIAFICTITVSYMLQLVYFRGVLYVAIGALPTKD
jgi:hypothetical protein